MWPVLVDPKTTANICEKESCWLFFQFLQDLNTALSTLES
jgi:hypothetical protein